MRKNKRAVNWKWQQKQTQLTKKRIIDAALQLTLEIGYHKLRRDNIAAHARVSPGLIAYHFGTVEKLRREVMRTAIRKKLILIIAQGITMRNPDALKAPLNLKKKATKFLLT